MPLKGIVKYADISATVNWWTATNSPKSVLINSLLGIHCMPESSLGHEKEITKIYQNTRR